MFRVKWFRSHLGLLLACGAMAEAIRAHLPALAQSRKDVTHYRVLLLVGADTARTWSKGALVCLREAMLTARLLLPTSN